MKIPNARSILTRSDYEDYLVRVYFGTPSEGFLTACIDRAYLDFNRTLRGLSKVESKQVLHKQAATGLRAALDELKTTCAYTINSTQFDTWHRTTCQNLSSIYAGHGYPQFYVGQAQKWINMALKYIFVLGEHRVDGFIEAYQFCHVPFDEELLKRLAKYNFPELPRPWSRINDYDQYLDRQEWIRNTFKDTPLDVEFQLWLGKDVRPEGRSLAPHCSQKEP